MLNVEIPKKGPFVDEKASQENLGLNESGIKKVLKKLGPEGQ